MINVWTVDAPEDIRGAVRLDVDGIITNVPDVVVVRKVLDEMNTTGNST